MTLLALQISNAVTASSLALLAAGILAPLLTQLTKSKLGVSSLKAYFLHLFIAFGLAAGALAVNGELTGATFAQKASIVAVLGTTLFKLFKGNSGLEVEPVEPEE